MRKSAEFTMENDKGTLSVRLQELTVREVLDMCEQFGKGPLVHDLERVSVCGVLPCKGKRLCSSCCP